MPAHPPMERASIYSKCWQSFLSFTFEVLKAKSEFSALLKRLLPLNQSTQSRNERKQRQGEL